jgi:hypothetical protein
VRRKARIAPPTLTHAHIKDFGMNIIEKLLADHEAWRKRVSRRPTNRVRKRDRPKCGAYARSTGQPCRAKALDNGRCRNHGGMSTGPKTPEGKVRSLANLKQYQKPN